MSEMLGANNKYRRIQGKLLELDDAAKNEVGEEMYKLIRQRVIEPMNSFLFQLHLAFEEGRDTNQRTIQKKLYRKKLARKKKVSKAAIDTTIPNNQLAVTTIQQ